VPAGRKGDLVLFDSRNFWRFCCRWLAAPGWTGRRLLVTAAFFAIYPLLEIAVWTGLLLDRILFRGYRREPVTAPVFIIGNPRSGTTFLHRLLARDTKRFTTMRMWEILFAPSLAQRTLLRACASILRRWHKAPGAMLDRIEQQWYSKYGMHLISFNQPEEDDYLLLHIWSALTCGLSAGLIDEAVPYTFFDQALPPARRRRIMAFYKSCVQRHLHDRRRRQPGGPGTYLAKNPALSPKIRSVKALFPDARFIYIVRSPLEMVPSYVSMMIHSWRAVGIRDGRATLRNYVTCMARHWYTYPPAQLNALGAEHVVVSYAALIRDPERTVRDIYARFGLQPGPEFARILRQECARARTYRSRHAYDPNATGCSRERLIADFKEILAAFPFTKEGNSPCDGHPY